MSESDERIESCLGVEGCFGLVKRANDNTPINPIVFRSNRKKICVMVITEQPKGHPVSKGTLKEILRKGPQNSVPQ